MNEQADEITALLTKAMDLIIAADPGYTGHYALIAQATVHDDATYVMSWRRYYSPPDDNGTDGTALLP